VTADIQDVTGTLFMFSISSDFALGHVTRVSTWANVQFSQQRYFDYSVSTVILTHMSCSKFGFNVLGIFLPAVINSNERGNSNDCNYLNES